MYGISWWRRTKRKELNTIWDLSRLCCCWPTPVSGLNSVWGAQIFCSRVVSFEKSLRDRDREGEREATPGDEKIGDADRYTYSCRES